MMEISITLYDPNLEYTGERIAVLVNMGIIPILPSDTLDVQPLVNLACFVAKATETATATPTPWPRIATAAGLWPGEGNIMLHIECRCTSQSWNVRPGTPYRVALLVVLGHTLARIHHGNHRAALDSPITHFHTRERGRTFKIAEDQSDSDTESVTQPILTGPGPITPSLPHH